MEGGELRKEVGRQAERGGGREGGRKDWREGGGSRREGREEGGERETDMVGGDLVHKTKPNSTLNTGWT